MKKSSEKGKMWASERSRRFGSARVPEPRRVRCCFFSFSEEKEKKQKKKSSIKKKRMRGQGACDGAGRWVLDPLLHPGGSFFSFSEEKEKKQKKKSSVKKKWG